MYTWGFFLISSLLFRVVYTRGSIFNLPYTLLGSEWQRVIFNLLFPFSGSVYRGVIFNLFFTLLGSLNPMVNF